jgi:hypothetical protein
MWRSVFLHEFRDEPSLRHIDGLRSCYQLPEVSRRFFGANSGNAQRPTLRCRPALVA